MSALRRVAPLAGLLAGELAAVGLLHALGEQPWARVPMGESAPWVGAAPPVEALMAALRLVGLGVGWWLLVTTAATAAATLARAERLAGLVRPMTWAVARRAADRAVAAGVTVALLAPAGPALADAADPPPPALSEPADVEPAPSEDRADDEPAGSRDSRGDGEGRDPRERRDSRERRDESRMHEIAAGEHLWGIAAEALAAHRGVAPDQLGDREIATHWREVIEANDGRLRSGDPDLVYPGEQLRLPPPPA